MKFSWFKGKDKKDSSLGLFHAESATSAMENAGIAYQSQSVIAAGASVSGVALLSSLTNLFLSIFLLRVPSLLEGPRTSIRRTVLILAIANTMTWVPLATIMILFAHVSPLILTALWIVNIIPAVLLGPLRDYWLANIVPTDKMGRYLSWRSVITGAAYLATFYGMGMILQATADSNSMGFFIILLFALLSSAASALLYTRIKPPSALDVKNKDSDFGFLTFLKQAKNSHLGVFILFVSMFTFATNIAGPLFASYMMGDQVGDLHFNYMTYTVIISFEFIARVFSLTFWGKMVDKSGSLKVIGTVTYLIPFVPILWLFSSNIAYLCMIQAFSGVIWSAFDLGVQTFIYKATSPAQRLRYIVYYKSLTSFSVALGALTGALLVNNVVPIFGSKILTLFLLSGILRMAVARVMLPKLTQDGIPGAVIHEELANELAALKVPVFQDGLYYHPEAWGRFSRRAYIIGNNIGKTINKLNPAKMGLFYQPNQWAKYTKTNTETINLTAKEPKSGLYNNPKSWADYMRQQGVTQTAPVTAAVQPVREGLYYHKDEWQQQNEQITTAKGKNRSRIVEKKGLFHNPEQWVDYLKQGIVLNATTMQTVNGTSLRQPVYYHPEAWEKYKKETANIMTSKVKLGSSKKALLYHPEDWKRFSATSLKKKPGRPNTNAGIPVKRVYINQPKRQVTSTAGLRKPKLAPVIAQ